MSTRGIFTFRDDEDRFHIYKHFDCYPHGGLSAICNALHFAWQMPRFEADEFAAAFCAANKGRLSAAAIEIKRKADTLPENDFMQDFSIEGPLTLNRYYRQDGGGVRLLQSGPNVHWHDAAPGDVEYHFDVYADGKKLMVTVSDICWDEKENRYLETVWSGDILPMKDFTWDDWNKWGTQLNEKLEAA